MNGRKKETSDKFYSKYNCFLACFQGSMSFKLFDYLLHSPTHSHFLRSNSGWNGWITIKLTSSQKKCNSSRTVGRYDLFKRILDEVHWRTPADGRIPYPVNRSAWWWRGFLLYWRRCLLSLGTRAGSVCLLGFESFHRCRLVKLSIDHECWFSFLLSFGVETPARLPSSVDPSVSFPSSHEFHLSCFAVEDTHREEEEVSYSQRWLLLLPLWCMPCERTSSRFACRSEAQSC